jgi:hypothetical protein
MIRHLIFTMIMWILVKMRIANESNVTIFNGAVVKTYSSSLRRKGLYR